MCFFQHRLRQMLLLLQLLLLLLQRRTNGDGIKEAQVLRLGQKDYDMSMNRRHPPGSDKPLLCASFQNASVHSTITLISNMQAMDEACDWAVVFYQQPFENYDIDRVCKNPRLRDKLVLCTATSYTVTRHTVPKAVLYNDILNITPDYKRVFLVGEDTSLMGFNVDKFMNLWDCAFAPQPPPLVVTPLTAHSSHLYRYFNIASWRTPETSDVLASAVGMVEDDVAPMMDARFFEFFVRRVLVKTKTMLLATGRNWGTSRLWCGVAAAYAANVLNYTTPDDNEELKDPDVDLADFYTACAIMVDPGVGSIYLRPFVANPLVIEDMSLERTVASTILKRYETFFPDWLVLQPQSELVDPLARTPKTHAPPANAFNATNASSGDNGAVDGASADEMGQVPGGKAGGTVLKPVLRKIYAYDETCNGNRRGGETP